MQINDLFPAPGSRKSRKRVGRGNGSGHGSTSGRGDKGQGSRAGGTKGAGFEGGQTPLAMRLPKLPGFKNRNRVEFSVVNVSRLDSLFADGDTVDAEALVAKGIIKSADEPVKVLGDGELSKKLAVKVDKVSGPAKQKIEAAGGTVEGTVLTAIANAFRVPELRRKILFTLAMIALYRLGAFIPVPGINIAKVQTLINANQALGLLGLFSGGALEKLAVFSLGIMPYITSSIIMQLLQGVIPTVEKWAKEGESGQRKITQITRYMTLGIALLESVGLLATFRSAMSFGPGAPPAWFTQLVIVITLIAGTAFIMWMGELMTQHGIGNGMSLLIFASIISRFPQAIVQSFTFGNGVFTGLLLLVTLFVIAAIVTMERAQRRIPVQYAKRVVGRRVYGGSGTYIPLKINGANVIPIIFASAILFFPAQIAAITGNTFLIQVGTALQKGPVNWVLEFALIVFFTYFYTALVFNPIDLSDNLRKNGGFIPGVRPGSATTRYIENVLNRITLPGALFLGVIAVVPSMLFYTTNNVLIQSFGGTSILIMVGVALETMTQLESQLKMRHYEGFFK